MEHLLPAGLRFMSSSACRLLWLSNEIASGREAFVSFSYNSANRKEKISFTLGSVLENASIYRPSLLCAINSVWSALDLFVVTDKGHKSVSRCRTVVDFWIGCPLVADTAVASDASVVASPPAVADGCWNGSRLVQADFNQCTLSTRPVTAEPLHCSGVGDAVEENVEMFSPLMSECEDDSPFLDCVTDVADPVILYFNEKLLSLPTAAWQGVHNKFYACPHDEVVQAHVVRAARKTFKAMYEQTLLESRLPGRHVSDEASALRKELIGVALGGILAVMRRCDRCLAGELVLTGKKLMEYSACAMHGAASVESMDEHAPPPPSSYRPVDVEERGG